MSLFLGKIHYWLYNKVLWFEGLEEEIIDLAKTKGIYSDTIKEEINSKHGEKSPNKPLEEIIDQSNIHGWLQASIHSAEGRMAHWIKVILDKDQSNIEEIKAIFIKQGKAAAEEVKASKEIKSAEDIFNSMNDYVLDGMPCDRVNEVVSKDENEIIWTRRLCVHKDIWEKQGVEVAVFYSLRDNWIKSFVENVDSKFEFVKSNDNKQIIKKIG